MKRRIRVSILVVAALAALSGVVTAGPYRAADNGISYDDVRFVGWATGIDMHWPAGFVPAFNDPTEALGPAPGTPNDVVTLGNEGWAVLTFDRVIRDNPGPDLAVFENGHSNPIFAELAFVEVSTGGDDYARFPSVSLTASWPGEYGTLDATDIHNLAGKHINNYDQAWLGTPFDLADLARHPSVTGGLVDLDNINYVRIVDIYGHDNGTTYDEATSVIDPTTGFAYATDHVIYDGGNYGLLLSGFDLDAVGILEPIPEPATVGIILLAAGALTGFNAARRRKLRGQ